MLIIMVSDSYFLTVLHTYCSVSDVHIKNSGNFRSNCQ